MLPVLFLFTLCGCSADLPTGEEIRAQYAELTAATATVKILSDIGVSALEYQAEYQYNRDGEDLLTVIAPEELAGIGIRIEKEPDAAFSLQYASTALYLAADEANGTRPADAPSALLRTLCTAEPTAVGRDLFGEHEALHLSYHTPDSDPAVSHEVWLDARGFPLCAEVFSDGEKRVTLFFTDFAAAS